MGKLAIQTAYSSHYSNKSIQDATLAHYAGYTKEEILPVFHLMVDYLHRPVAHEAFFKKYASKKFMKGILFSPFIYTNPRLT